MARGGSDIRGRRKSECPFMERRVRHLKPRSTDHFFPDQEYIDIDGSCGIPRAINAPSPKVRFDRQALLQHVQWFQRGGDQDRRVQEKPLIGESQRLCPMVPASRQHGTDLLVQRYLSGSKRSFRVPCVPSEQQQYLLLPPHAAKLSAYHLLSHLPPVHVIIPFPGPDFT